MLIFIHVGVDNTLACDLGDQDSNADQGMGEGSGGNPRDVLRSDVGSRIRDIIYEATCNWCTRIVL